MSKKKKSSFRGKVSRNVEKQDSAAASYGYLLLPKGSELFKPVGGSRYNLDFIPYLVTDEHHIDKDDDEGIAMPGDIWYKKPFLIHRNIGASNDTVICPTTFGKKCPICEYRAKMFKEGADQEVTKALKTSLRNLYLVIPIDDKKYDDKIHLMDISQAMFQELLNEELKEDEDYEVFPDLEEGLTLRVRFDEKSIGKNKFPETSRIDFKERDHEYDEEKMLEKAPNLDEMLKVHTYSELSTMFFDMEDPEEDGDEPRKTETRKDKSSKKKKVSDEEQENGDEGDEEETPKRSTLSRSKKKNKKEDKPKRSTGSKKECPHGHKFGVDTDNKDECDTCDVWNACIDEKEKK